MNQNHCTSTNPKSKTNKKHAQIDNLIELVKQIMK
jgi:hypothetical protein